MSYLDAVAQKRLESQQLKASKDTHTESLEAVKGSGKEIVKATDTLAKTSDIDHLIEQVKEVQLAAMLGASKPSVVLTDQTDLGDKMEELGEKLARTIAQIDTSGLAQSQLQELSSLTSAVKTLSAMLLADPNAKELLKAVKSLKLNPTISVPQPKVTVQSAQVDLKPLQNMLETYLKPPEVVVVSDFDLSSYKAQDIDNSQTNYQYIGFLNPSGKWYIIENDVKANSLRYVFGSTGYEKAFKKASTYEYSLLSEAINAL